MVEILCPAVFQAGETIHTNMDQPSPIRSHMSDSIKRTKSPSTMTSESSEFSDREPEIELNQICIVMDLMENDLNQMLKSDINFSQSHLIRIVYNSLCSLSFLHEANVMHRDIKPSNIIINADCDAKLCDFGLSRTIP